MEGEKKTKTTETLVFWTNKYDLNTGAILDENGDIVHIRKQSSDVLSVLASNAGEIVGKEVLIEKVWPDTVTTDDSLVQCISDIRRALGRESIKTFPKKGYRLQPSGSDERERWASGPGFLVLLGGALCLLLITGVVSLYWPRQSESGNGFVVSSLRLQEKSLAVLPFVNLGGDPSIQYFSDGISEDLTTDLSRVLGLTVISSASSFYFPEAESGFKKIAKELGVQYLVRGTVRHHGNQIRINVSLFDGVDGFNLWAERFDRARDNPFDAQDEIAVRIVRALSLKVDKGMPTSRQVDPDAYFLLLKGLVPHRKRTRKGNIEARGYFEHALALDPQYARAHASIAVTYGRESALESSNELSREFVEKGLEFAISAIRLDPNIPHAYLALGLLNLSIQEYDQALAAVHHAIKLDGNYADGFALLAEISLYGGELEEALEAIRWAKLLHPYHPPSYSWIEGHALYLLEKYDEAQPLLEEATSSGSEFMQGFIVLAANYAQQGAMSRAFAAFATAQEINNDVNPMENILHANYKFGNRRALLLEGLRKARGHSGN